MEAVNLMPKSRNLPDIRKDWQVYKSKKIKQFPQNNLRASSIGHECDRYHYHSIKDWREKTLHDPVLQSIFDEGNLHEGALIRELEAMGFEISEQQRSFQVEKPLITGHIDGILHWEGQRFPFDIKTIQPFDFKKINTIQDLLESSKNYQRHYAAQLQIYLYQTEEEVGLFILKNKLTGEIKPIWMELNLEFVEEILRRAERVYQSLHAEIPPERTTNFNNCKTCAFAHVCLPDLRTGEGVKDLDDLELAGMLDRREALEKAYNEYREIDSSIKEQGRAHGVSELVCGDYLIRTTEVKQSRKVPITWDIKKTSYLKSNILKLGS